MGINDFETSFINTRKIVEELQRDVLLKANIKDVCILLDTKASQN